MESTSPRQALLDEVEHETSKSPDSTPTMFYIAQHETSRVDPATPAHLGTAQNVGYDMITTPITTPAFHATILSKVQAYIGAESQTERQESLPLPILAPLSPIDSSIAPDETNSALVGVVSPWIDLASRDPVIAHISKGVLTLEVAYASFCGITNIILLGPGANDDVVQYARTVLESLRLGPFIQLHILLPMSGESDLDLPDGTTHLAELARNSLLDLDADGPEIADFDNWETWNSIRNICNYNSRISIALELPRQLPSTLLQSRWFSEPVRLLVYPRTSFLRNAKQFPVLSKPHQQLLSRFASLRLPPWIVLCDVGPGDGPEPTPAEAAAAGDSTDDATKHLRYLRHLQETQPQRPPIERFGQGYQDFLQSPLQPLADNLESITYEVFEKDPVKYEWYERAIALALKDISKKLGGTQKAITVAVVGSGRGPLVTRALQASSSTGISIQCWAVEKNPNAYVLLQRRNATDPVWNFRVNVVKADMRHWAGPADSKVDILVSELLGSFGDNELSPECLDGVQHVLHPDHGISIPQRYSAHLTPLSSQRLYTDLKIRVDPSNEKWEVPYVVMLQQCDFLSYEFDVDSKPQPIVKEAWSFSHPAPKAVLEQARKRVGGSDDAGSATGGDGQNEHNSRSRLVSFKCANRGVCHGIAGYFETVLYASTSSDEAVELSTNPVTIDAKSKDMISWFPIFFPLKTPVYIPDDSTIEVNMWRLTDDRKVWYEWVVNVFAVRDGRKQRLAGSELHSSYKNGCML